MNAQRAIGIAVLLMVAVPLPAVEIETTAKKLEGELMSPCCMTNTVSEHFSRASADMKIEIRQMLGEGKTEQEIIDFYVAKHGDQILAVPPAEAERMLGEQPLSVPLSVIGEFVTQPGLRQKDSEGRTSPLVPRGYQHEFH